MTTERALRIIERECRASQRASECGLLVANIGRGHEEELRGTIQQCQEVRKLCRRIRAMSKATAKKEQPK